MNITSSTPIEVYNHLDNLFKEGEWLSWEPETVLTSLKECINGEDICKDKILAVQGVAANATLVLTNNRAFEKVVHAFCNNPCIMDIAQPPQIEEIHWAIPHIQDIIVASQEDIKRESISFTGEIPGYVAGVAKYHGWLVLPKRLNFAKEMLDNLNGIKGWNTKEQDIALIISQAQSLADQLDDIELDTAGLDALEEDTPRNIMIRRLVGCCLFKPY